MITTVTLNPMLDKTVRVESLRRGSIHRATAMAMVAGGKGINVSRQLKSLGEEALATGFLGGATGNMVRELMDHEGIRHDFVETGILTREGVTYLESGGKATAVFEPSLKPPVESVHELSRKIDAYARESSWIVCSGSSPGGEADDVFYEAILSAHRAGCRSALDSYGVALTLGLKGLPTLVKLNKTEFEQSFWIELKTEADIRREVTKLVSTGVEFCMITDGSRPVYAASKRGEWKVTVPAVLPVNAVGSGDAMMAGILHGFERGWEFERCIKFGAAAGVANSLVWEVARASADQIVKEEQNILIEQLA